MKKKILQIVLIVVMISITATAVACERENHGIPHGTYKPCVDGEIGDWVLEDCWRVYDEAEYRYNKFSVIEDEEGVWFYKYNDYIVVNSISSIDGDKNENPDYDELYIKYT